MCTDIEVAVQYAALQVGVTVRMCKDSLGLYVPGRLLHLDQIQVTIMIAEQ